MIKINTKFLISILVILLLLSLINQYTRIIENNSNEKEQAEANNNTGKAASDMAVIEAIPI